MFVALELPPLPWSLRVARNAIDQLLCATGVDETGRGLLAVVLNEACGNVVRHAGVPDPYRVRVEVRDGTCVIDVTDEGVGVRDHGAAADPDDGGRFGLTVVRALVDQLSLEPRDPRGTRF